MFRRARLGAPEGSVGESNLPEQDGFRRRQVIAERTVHLVGTSIAWKWVGNPYFDCVKSCKKINIINGLWESLAREKTS